MVRHAVAEVHMLLILRALVAAAVRRLGTGRIRGVEVLRLDRYDVMVVRELACMGAEAEIGNRWDRHIVQLEALRPLGRLLVLQLELKV